MDARSDHVVLGMVFDHYFDDYAVHRMLSTPCFLGISRTDVLHKLKQSDVMLFALANGK